MLRGEHPSVDLRLTEAEPPEAVRMLRAGYVDVALIFRHEPEGRPGDEGDASRPAHGPGDVARAGAASEASAA